MKILNKEIVRIAPDKSAEACLAGEQTFHVRSEFVVVSTSHQKYFSVLLGSLKICEPQLRNRVNSRRGLFSSRRR